MKIGDTVLVYHCKMRLGGDFGKIIGVDANDKDSFLVESSIIPDFDFWVDKRYLNNNPFVKQTLWQKIKETILEMVRR